MPNQASVEIFSGSREQTRRAAELFVFALRQKRAARLTVALAGGRTPRALYRLLADRRRPYRAKIPWSKVHFFWGDERAFPPNHPESNFRMASEELLSKIPVRPGRIHPIRFDEAGHRAAARRYEVELSDFFKPRGGKPPRFDLIILGMGDDGHVASLFPRAPGINARRLAVPAHAKGLDRVSLALPVLNAGLNVMVLVSGNEKAGAVAAALGRRDKTLPASRLRPNPGRLYWLLDRFAASNLASARK